MWDNCEGRHSSWDEQQADGRLRVQDAHPAPQEHEEGQVRPQNQVGSDSVLVKYRKIRMRISSITQWHRSLGQDTQANRNGTDSAPDQALLLGSNIIIIGLVTSAGLAPTHFIFLKIQKVQQAFVHSRCNPFIWERFLFISNDK